MSSRLTLPTHVSPPGVPLWRAYLELNRFAWSTPCPIVRANDKFFYHAVVPIRPFKLFGFDKFTGYTKAKIGQLIRNYLPEGQVELTRDRIKKRMSATGRIDQFMSAGVRIGTGKKDTVKKPGECISGLTFHLIPAKWTTSGKPEIDVQVFFRVSEITMRLLGDFMFIDYICRQVLGPLGYMKHLGTVTLYLASYYALVPEFPFWECMYPPAYDELDMKNDTFKKAHWERMLSIIKTGINPKAGTPTNYIAFQKKKKRVDRLAKIPSLYVKDPDGRVALRAGYEEYKGPTGP